MSVIKNRTRAKQLHDFSGLVDGKRSPMDIDMFLDLRGKGFIYGESKIVGEELPVGQRRALENVIDSHDKADHQSICIIYEHESLAVEDVDVAECLVRSYYFHGAWHTPKLSSLTVREVIDLYECTRG